MSLLGDTWDDPRTLGLLAAAQAMMQQRGVGGLLSGATVYGGALAQAKDKERAIAQEKLKQELLRAQIGETQAQAQQRAAEAEKMKAAQAQALVQQAAQDRFLSSPFTNVGVVAPSIMTGSGQRSPEENAALPRPAQQFDYAAAVRAFGPEGAKKLMEGFDAQRNFGRDKITREVQGTMPGTNLPATLLYGDYGPAGVAPIPKAVPFKLEDFGGTKNLFNEFTGQIGQGTAKTQTPDGKASNAVAWANHAATLRGQDLVNARAADHNRIAAGNNLTEGESKLRKEFEGLPEVKSYKQAFPSYSGIVDAAKRNTPMADINIVYGLAKLYDPNSVVREGEYATVANAPAIPERVKGWAQYVSGGGKLTEETKAQILAEAKSRINSYADEFNKARTSYGGIAKRYGMNAENIFADAGDAVGGPAKIDRVPQKPLPGVDTSAIEAELRRRGILLTGGQ